jgi:hypothetical protein
MGSLSDEMQEFVLEWLGQKKKGEDTSPPKEFEDTWVLLSLKDGSRLGGRLSFFTKREAGMDLCLTDVCEVKTDGQWRPTHWKSVEGTQCVIISANDYSFLQFLDSAPEILTS